MSKKERVVVLGASHKPERYSYKAIQALLNSGHEVIPVHPSLKEIQGLKVINKLEDIKDKVDTVTLYVGPDRQEQMVDGILALKPKRIIANPGAESDVMSKAADKNKIEYVEACTLVLLATGQF